MLPYCITERCMQITTPGDWRLQVCMAATTVALIAAFWLRVETWASYSIRHAIPARHSKT